MSVFLLILPYAVKLTKLITQHLPRWPPFSRAHLLFIDNSDHSQHESSITHDDHRQAWKEQLEREQSSLLSLTGAEREQAEKAIKDRRVHPVDAPRGSLRSRLFASMTSTESSSKAAASDLLFNLCGNEGNQIMSTGCR